MNHNEPVHTIRRVTPRCSRCGSEADLVRGDGPVICRDCIRMLVRLSGVKP